MLETRIPKRFTGEGEDVSPPLALGNFPTATREIAMICDDPDAPTEEPWVHWVLYGIPKDTTAIPESDNGGGIEGKNSWDTLGYRGPLPPEGHGLHHYLFKVYALDAEFRLAPGLTKKELLEAMAGHVLEQGELIGTYERG